jgi:purine-nucleoside phosphorylase
MGRPLPTPGDGVADEVAEAIRERWPERPHAAVVLGSGLGTVLEVARERAGGDGIEIGYEDLPGFPRPSVPGHAGRLWLGTIGATHMVVFQGRVHHYEGHPMSLASLTSRVAAILGASSIVLTTAVGALDPSLRAGSLVVVRDHVNLMGDSPLRGWRMPDGSPPFVDVSALYDAELSDAALEAARAADVVPVAEGVYAAVAGPSYETPAETAFLRTAGGTVVGMSMVPEAVVARASGLRVLGLSFVTNVAGGSVSHEEVLEASDRAADAIGQVLVALLDRIRSEGT